MVRERNGNSWTLGSRGGNEMWTDSGYILKVGLIWFIDRLILKSKIKEWRYY